MTSAGKRLALVLLLVTGGGAFWIINNRPGRPSAEVSRPPVSRERAAAHDLDSERERADGTARRRVAAEWKDLLEWLRSEPAPTEDEVRERLLATRKSWKEMDPQVLAEMIAEILKTGADAPTGMDFKVGIHGLLAGWPTMRVFLLDVLALSDPEMAAVTARDLLGKTNSPDEFAAGLRSLTREGPGEAGNEELQTNLGKMLDRTDWQNSRGFAEALDLGRFIGSSEAAARLANWKGNPALKRMALDEFTADHPAAMLEAIESNPSLTGSIRAHLMARANPEDSRQIETVDAYLRSPGLPEDEANAFLNTYPLRSTTTGYRIYGDIPSPYTHEQIKAGDRAAYAQVADWLDDPGLQKYQPQLTALQQRLATWIEQADRVESDD